MLPFYFIMACTLLAAFADEESLDNSTNFNKQVNHFCPPWQTECYYGCCPYADAVCCVDGYECCQHGQTCIPYVGLCIGAELRNGNKTTLFTQKAVTLTTWDSERKVCPTWSTPCYNACCPMQHAVCCTDQEHCCPDGYQCSPDGCIR